MNIKQAKEKFTLESLLSSLGHSPDVKKSKGNDLWYKSPFRPNENTPSFHINTARGFYKDFGDTEKGGDLIWFAQMYLKHRGQGYSVSDALKWFDDLDGNTQIHSFNANAQHKKEKPISKEEVYLILSNKDIFSTSLIDYLKRKDIPLTLAKKYLRQIYFQNLKSGKKIFGLGFKTRVGGFDIRTANGFKTMIGQKDITIVKGEQHSVTIDVFEGASDFLTMLSIEERNTPGFDTIILNSGNLYEVAATFITKNHYSNIRLWLDNDEAGRKFEKAFLIKLQESRTTFTINRMNHIYDGFKDLNMWHTQANITLPNKKSSLLETPKNQQLKNCL